MGTDTRTADKDAIQAVLVDSYKAWAAGDADGMVADYTEDATVMMPGVFRRDRQEIRDSMAAGFAGPLQGTSTDNEPLAIRFVGADGAIVLTRAAILFPGESEVPDARKVNCTWVFERRDGRWLIAAYHNSPVVAPGH